MKSWERLPGAPSGAELEERLQARTKLDGGVVPGTVVAVDPPTEAQVAADAGFAAFDEHAHELVGSNLRAGAEAGRVAQIVQDVIDRFRRYRLTTVCGDTEGGGMHDVAVDIIECGVTEGCGDVVEFVARPGALLLLVVDLVGQVVGITFQQAAVEAEQVGLVEVENLELVVPCILVDLTMSVEALECAAHEGVAEGEMLVQVLLAAADELEN